METDAKVPTLARVRKAIREDAPPLCPNRKQHTPHPEGYLAHAAWAEKKLKTHKQIKCPGCGLWAIWVRRPAPSSESEGKS